MSGRNENICFRVTDQDVIGLRLDKYLIKNAIGLFASSTSKSNSKWKSIDKW